MAHGVNMVILVGYLGKDPVITYTPNGTAIARLLLATTGGRKNQEGVWEQETEWHDVRLFGKNAEVAGKYPAKGALVCIEGKIENNHYEKDGVKKRYTYIVGRKLLMLGRRKEKIEK